jgi:hypothetical protein
MSKIVGFVVGAVLIGIGIATRNVGLIIEGAALIVTQAVVDLTMPKTPAREASEMSIALGEQPRVALFGETNTPGSLVDGFNYGGKYGTDWEVLVIRLADHKCEGLTGFYVNDLYVAYTGDGLYPAFNTDHLAVYFRADTTATALPSIVTTYGPGWTSADVGESGCDVIVAYRADEPKNKHPVWPGGRPHFSWVVKGKRCYDPRKDTTVGGSGSHLWADPTTWEWSENPAVCRYNWARGIFANDQVTDPSSLLIGRGLTAAEAPPANIFPAANLCDEVVGSGVRYRVAGPVYANQTFIDVEQMFAIACAGSVVTHEGDVQLEPGQAKSIVATITDADLLVAGKVSWNQGILSESSPEWVNTVVVNYIEPTQQWASHQAPPARTVADVVADGRPREAQVALRLVKDLNQAQRVAEILRRLGRLWGRAGIVLGPRFCELEEGDWISWQSDRYFAGATKTFRIEAYTIDEKWQNSLTLREIDASVFDGVFAFDSDHSVTTPTTPPPAIGSPGSSQWALAAVTLANGGASVPALEITGSASDDIAVQEIVVEYWKSDGVINPVTNPDDPPWVMEGSHPPTTTKVDITSIQGGQVYYAAVSYVVSGITGDRRVLGPVTAASIDVSGQVSPLIDAAVGKLAWKQPVRAKTTAALAANTYANGTAGVGATLTATVNGALAAVDGVTLAVNDRLIVDHETTASHNGIYKVTQLGDGSHPYILTRSTDADEAAELINAAAKVEEGATFADQEWQCTTNATIVVGTTALTWHLANEGMVEEAPSDGTSYVRKNAAWVAESSGGGGATAFTGLSDAPASYSGAHGRLVAVKADQTGLEFVDQSVYLRIGSFSKWQTAKARGSTAPARMAFIGDSNVVGEGAGTGTRNLTGAFAASPAKKLATLLSYRTDHFFGDQNVTIAPSPVNYNTYDPRVTLGTGWAPDAGNSNTLGGRFFIAAGGSAGKLRFTPASNVTKFRFWYPTTSGLNSAFTVGVDGTTVDTFSESAANGYPNRQYSVALGAHYIEFGVGATGSGYVAGVETFDGTTTPSLLQLGQCGAIVSNLNDNSNPWNWKQGLALLAPDYAIVYCTIVDTESATSLSSYMADMEGLVATLAATADGCLVVGFPSSGVGTTNGYLNELAIMLRNLAQDYDWSFIDLRPQLGHSNTRAGTLSVKFDAKHPNAAGGTAIANQLYAILSPGLS